MRIAAMAEKYPDWKGKTLGDAINPHTAAYEAIDPGALPSGVVVDQLLTLIAES